jgi:hypothetical protein
LYFFLSRENETYPFASFPPKEAQEKAAALATPVNLIPYYSTLSTMVPGAYFLLR